MARTGRPLPAARAPGFDRLAFARASHDACLALAGLAALGLVLSLVRPERRAPQPSREAA